jgi:hypothetical protein
MFRDGISSIPGETVIPLWLGGHFLVYENRVYHGRRGWLLVRISLSIARHCPLYPCPPPFSYPSIFIRVIRAATIKQSETSGPKYGFTVLKNLNYERAIQKKSTRMQEVQMSTLCNWASMTHNTVWHYGTLVVNPVFRRHTIRKIHFSVNAFSYWFFRFALTKTRI